MTEMGEMHCLCWLIFRDSKAAQSYLGTQSAVVYFKVDCGWILQGKVKVGLMRVVEGWQWQPIGWQSGIAKALLEERYRMKFSEVIG